MAPCALVFVMVPLVCAVGSWRYDALNFCPLEQIENPFPGIIGWIGQKRLNIIKNAGQQCVRALQVAGLSRRQMKAGRIAEGVAGGVDFRGRPTRWTPDAFRLPIPPFASAACRWTRTIVESILAFRCRHPAPDARKPFAMRRSCSTACAARERRGDLPVSYTHLTLPTSDLV